MLKRILIPITLLSVASAAVAQNGPASTAVGGVLVSPLLHRLNVRSSEATTVEFDCANPTSVNASATFEIKSFMPKAGSYTSDFDVDHPQDASKWFADKTQTLQFKPGEQKHVVLKLKVPGGAKGVFWCMARFLPRLEGATRVQTIAYEIPIVLTVGKAERAVVNFSTPEVAPAVAGVTKGVKVVKVSVENQGPGFTPLGAEGEVTTVPGGRVVHRFSVGDRNLFPGTKRDLTFMLPPLPDGRYHVDVRPETGRRRLPAVSSDFVMKGGAPEMTAKIDTKQLSPLAMEPVGFADEMPRGASRSQILRITNLSDREMDIELKVMSVEQSVNGSVGAADKPVKGITVTPSPDTVHLDPHGAAIARIELKVDDDADGDHWYAISLSEKGNGKAIAETTIGNLTVKGTRKPLMEVTQTELQKAGEKLIAIKFQAKNTGNVAVRPEPSAAILEDGVRLVNRIEVPVIGDGGFLPGTAIPNTLFLPQDLKPGNYTVEISYQYGETDFAKLRVPFTVKAAAPAKAPVKAPASTPSKGGAGKSGKAGS